MNVPFSSIDSRSELLERLRRGGPGVLLGADDEATNQYFIAANFGCLIGVCSQGQGIRPSAFTDDSGKNAWVGYNRSVACVDVAANRIRFAVHLDAVFFCFLGRPMRDGSVVAIHELGAIRIGSNGEVLWSCATDIVTDFADEGGCCRLRTDSGEVTVNEQTGDRTKKRAEE